jgi:hypothetical protein
LPPTHKRAWTLGTQPNKPPAKTGFHAWTQHRAAGEQPYVQSLQSN